MLIQSERMGKILDLVPTQKRIIDQIIENSISMLRDYVDFDDNIDQVGLAIIEKYEKYADLVEMDGRDLENGHDFENVNN
jgi:hypothetical protein